MTWILEDEETRKHGCLKDRILQSSIAAAAGEILEILILKIMGDIASLTWPCEGQNRPI